MADPTRVRKQVYLLTIEDLNDHLFWEFCPDEEGEEGQDEATVKPFDGAYAPDRNCIRTADVTFADGTTAIGYIYWSGRNHDMGFTQPNIVTDSGQVNFWLATLRQESAGKDCGGI